jgi:5-methylcytosine-specific restriction endonuclease McrA
MPTGIYKRPIGFIPKNVFKKGYTPWNKGKIGYINKGSFKKGHKGYWLGKARQKWGNPLWDIKTWEREYRHKKGISKKYIGKYGGKVFTLKEHRQRRKALVKGGGEFPIERIQMVYENNIKKYGTLTCIYCLNTILFGQDTLEHKQPLVRGGTNEYNNLAIACQKCNSSKGKKTEEEYRKDFLR